MRRVSEREPGQSRDGGFGVVQRLLFRDPQGGSRHCAREPVDLDAVEVADADPDRIQVVAEVEGELTVPVQIGEDPVLDAAQFQVGFGQEVAGTAGGVEEPEAGDPVVQPVERVGAGPAGDRFRFGLFELRFQPVEEQRVDETVDVPDGRVVHAALAPFVMAERLLHEGAEDDGADAAPVEALADVQQGVTQLPGQRGHVDPVGEQAAVHVGERLQRFRQVTAPPLDRGVQHLEQVMEVLAQPVGRGCRHVVAERVRFEQVRVLRVQAEHEAYGQHRQRVMLRRIVRMFEAFRQRVMQSGDPSAGLDRQPLLLYDAGVLVREQAADLADMVRQVGKRELRLRRAGQRVGLQIVEAERSEIAGDEHGRAFRRRQAVRIPFRLLDRRDHAPLAWLRPVQVHAEALLLDEHPGLDHQSVDETVQRGAPFEPEHLPVARVRDEQHPVQQVPPVLLGVGFLVAASRPCFGELGRPALQIIHGTPSYPVSRMPVGYRPHHAARSSTRMPGSTGPADAQDPRSRSPCTGAVSFRPDRPNARPATGRTRRAAMCWRPTGRTATG